MCRREVKLLNSGAKKYEKSPHFFNSFKNVDQTLLGVIMFENPIYGWQKQHLTGKLLVSENYT